MKRDSSLAEIFDLTPSDPIPSGSEERRLSSSSTRVTEEFAPKELERVLSRPAGPYRIPEVEINRGQRNGPMLRSIMAAEGASHEQIAVNAFRAKLILPLSAGISVGVCFACFVLWLIA